MDLQSQINAYERQMAEIQISFQRKGESKPESARAAQVGAGSHQHRAGPSFRRMKVSQK